MKNIAGEGDRGGLSDGSISEIKQMGFKFQLIVSDKIQLLVILIFS